MELSSLIKKTGHHLVEIRERALKNIICKLDHALLSVPDLVQEKGLFVCLLQWFNFPEVPMQLEVLELLCSLAEHPTAAQMLRDVGAVEFLTQLSPKVEPRLRAIIDAIFDQLFRLPELPLLSADFSTDISHEPQPSSSESGAFARPQTVVESPAVGYFQTGSCERRQSESALQRFTVSNSVKCLKFSTFPWLALTTTDRHILSSNESSLRSTNHNLVRTTCELLQDVIMQDFPAEIFLHRPSIVQNLLSLLKLSGGGEEADYLVLQAVACLEQLCTNLRSRLRFHRDPSFYSAKQDTVSQNSSMSYSQEIRGTRQSPVPSSEECSPRPSVVGRTGLRLRGDGQDGDAASSSGSSSHQGATSRPPPQSPVETAHLELPEMEGEDVLELQLRQLSLAQFSIAVIEHALPLLKTESFKVFLRVLELLSESLLLLGDSVSELVWEDSSLIGQELRQKLLGSMGCLGDILYHHRTTSSSDETSLVHHRMAYVGTAIFTIRLVQTLLPVEKACENLPENTGAALFLLCMDPAFSVGFPSVHDSAVAYLEQANPDNYSIYRRVTQAVRFMETTCTFLKEVHAKGENNWLELIELAVYAIDGLPYHQHLPVVMECVQICSHLWKFAQSSPLLQTESQNIFLKLLSHPLQFVRIETYTCALSIVKDCLGLQNAGKRASSICNGVNFLLHPRVLYEICTFGLQDQAEKVNSAAKDLLLFLLKGQLMMTAPTWNRLTEAFSPVIPVLQGHAGTEDALGNCILLISEAPSEKRDGMFSNAARIRAAIRLLFTRQQSVRTAAVQHVMPHLTSAQGAGASRPVLDRVLLSTLPSLYLLTKLVDVKLGDTDRSFLKVESVNKLFSILSSETVDLVLRKSAAEQLAVVLQDTTMHPVLKSLGLSDKVIAFINDCVNSSVKNMDCLLEPSFCMLRKLVYADPTLRRSLAQRPAFLLALLRASLIVKHNRGDVAEGAALMCLLLFDEISRMDVWTDNSDSGAISSPFSLPISVIRRYNLPFQATSHHLVSPYCMVLPPFSDLLSLKPAWEMLQFAWNRAWHAGMDNLLDHLKGLRSDVIEFLEDLQMSATQGLLLRVTHISSALQDCLQYIRSAGSHSAVSAALARIHFYLLTDHLTLKPSPDSSKTVLKTLAWRPAIERFLQVHPACTEDEKLLADIVAFLKKFFKLQKFEVDEDNLQWILGLLLKQETNTLLNLLVRGESPQRGGGEEVHSLVIHRLQKELTGFFNTILHCLAHVSDRTCLASATALQTQLATRLLQCLRVSDAPHFYGLPSLERTLRGMVHVTALPGWSVPPLCVKYLSGLLEVISSFYVEWVGNSMSFMGKGVTKNAVLCLLQLSHEMMAESEDAEWISLWSLAHDQNDELATAHLGLAWLIPLWVDRDPEVRLASLGVGSALTSVEKGCFALAASCQNISGGLWGTVLNILMDQLECSMVRREAAFILQNLLVMPMPASMEEAKDFPWQSPCVHDEGSDLSLVGLPALQALLYHCQFFQRISQMAKSCFQGRYSFDLNFPAAPNHPDPRVEDWEDSGMHWRSPFGSINQTHVPGSVSTSSTLIPPEGLMEMGAPVQSSSGARVPDTSASRLLTQGQSDADTSSSVTSQESRAGDRPSEHYGVVTPHLTSAVCGLLTNLLAVLPEFTLSALTHHHILTSFASLVDTGVVEKCLCELKTPALLPGEDEDVKSQVLGLLDFMSSFFTLLQSVVVLSTELMSQMELIKPLLANAFTLLSLNIKGIDAGTRGAFLRTWTVLFTLLATLLRRCGGAVFPSVAPALGNRWQPFMGTISTCVQLSATEPALYTVALQFLSLALNAETQSRKQLASRASPSPGTTLSELLSDSPGSQLCEVILQCFEKRSFQDPLKKVSARALMSVLASSPSAQSHAFKAGLIESCVEQLKHIHAQLQHESLKSGKAVLKKREQESCLRELRMVLQVLRNCLCRHNECKAAASSAHLTRAVYAVWPWLLLDDAAMESALELLCVYTANCTEACCTLCWSSVGQASLTQRGPACHSLIHHVMRLATQVAPENSHAQRLAFSLLSNLAVSHDCRGVLQKSNFFQHFLSLPLPKPGSKSPSPAVTLWLKLFLSMSFGEDGQQLILKMSGSLELLADMSLYKYPGSSRPAPLVILHNICFSSTNKPKVLACGKAIGVLASCLENDQSDIRAIGASALWALLHNYQKAKVTLKSPSVKVKVDEAYITARREAEKDKDNLLNSYLLKCLENVTHLLNN